MIRWDRTVRGEVRRERDAIAGLRAKWGELDNPARIEALAKRFLPLKPIDSTQYSSLDQLPERPPELVQPGSPDPIGAFLDDSDKTSMATGSVTGVVKPSAKPNTSGGASADR